MNDSPKNMSFLQKAELETLWILCRGFAMLPHFVRHSIFGIPIYLIIRYVIRYRRKVIMTNLRNSFPEACAAAYASTTPRRYCARWANATPSS